MTGRSGSDEPSGCQPSASTASAAATAFSQSGIPNALIELAERCEQAAGPDRELDVDIAGVIVRPGEIPAYTASLDAAMSLVPEGLNRIVGTDNDGPFAQVGKPNNATPFISAATEPLALCAAALRARASNPTPPSDGELR